MWAIIRIGTGALSAFTASIDHGCQFSDPPNCEPPIDDPAHRNVPRRVDVENGIGATHLPLQVADEHTLGRTVGAGILADLDDLPVAGHRPEAGLGLPGDGTATTQLGEFVIGSPLPELRVVNHRNLHSSLLPRQR
jgi:hypothetical protein